MNTLESKTKLAAVRLVQSARRDRASYDEDCAEWAREGYRPHYCPHGMSLWVDYDVICGPCEDGRGSWDYLAELTDALGTARRAAAQCKRREDAMLTLIREGGDELLTDWRAMSDWVWSPLDKLAA